MKKCSRCGSGVVYDEESPVDCLTYRFCDTCGLYEPIEAEEVDADRGRIVQGLTRTVTSRYKRWGSR